ncbi:MAG: phage tail assembly chaperone [Brevundimonas sp.]|uniref:phage tail assembly chaperone n=1 Tax=Brevundimonas sp. TaxID=1871086 RepID=UPI00271B3743|nr:phage tail assembly chaperone [Brevundimonas sp.]MDO9607216.1 phage tail assembly chaperone [Brevundimonas sp.]
MLIFHAHHQTGVYLGSSTAVADPLELERARQDVFAPAAAAANAAFESAAAGLGDSEDDAVQLQQLRQILAASLASASAAAAAVEPTVFLIPAHAYTDAPPAFDFDEVAVRRDGAWVVEPIPEPADETPSQEELASAARSRRTWLISQVRWLVDRHRDEEVLQRPTTLTANDYLALLTYVQDLRDVPEQAGFPLDVNWPSLPAGIAPDDA